MRQHLATVMTALSLAAAAGAGPALASGGDARTVVPEQFQADRVVVLKSQRRLILMRGHRVLRVYRVALGRYAKGPKRRQGDSKTPEGRYVLDYRLDDSEFHRAIHISYPNEGDIARARAQGVSPGGQIMIHGLPKNWNAHRLNHPALDWTQGCIAVTNREIEEIWAAVPDGTPIDILP